MTSTSRNGRTSRNPGRSSPPSRRQMRRRALSRSLQIGAFAQAALTVAGLTCARQLFHADRLHGMSLLAAESVFYALPAYLAHLATGYLAPHLRWWHPLTAGLPGVILFSLVDRRVFTNSPPALRGYILVQLVVGPLAAAYAGHWYRLQELAADRKLEPKPWGKG